MSSFFVLFLGGGGRFCRVGRGKRERKQVDDQHFDATVLAHAPVFTKPVATKPLQPDTLRVDEGPLQASADAADANTTATMPAPRLSVMPKRTQGIIYGRRLPHGLSSLPAEIREMLGAPILQWIQADVHKVGGDAKSLAQALADSNLQVLREVAGPHTAVVRWCRHGFRGLPRGYVRAPLVRLRRDAPVGFRLRRDPQP